MKKEKVEIINQMISDLEDEKKTTQKFLNRNLDRISEINMYLQSLLDKEDNDFKVFSPRNIESIYHDQIEGSKQEEASLESENVKYYRELNRIDSMLEKMYFLLEDDSPENISPENISRETFMEEYDGKYASLDVQENERQRIARDLHDTSLQNLTAIVHKVELSSLYISQDPIRAKLEMASVGKSLRDIIEEIRNIVFDLRPMTFDDLGFKNLLTSFSEKESENKNFNIFIDECTILTNNDIVLVTLYRIVKECIINSIKHSQCKEIHVSIHEENHNIHVVISDDGCGFDYKEKIMKNDKHFGLLIMKERVQLLRGKMNIRSVTDEGTTYIFDVPISKKEEE